MRLAELDRSQEWLAKHIGMHPSLLSRYLRGLRPAPAALETRIDEVLSRHAAAARAAEDARQRALAS